MSQLVQRNPNIIELYEIVCEYSIKLIEMFYSNMNPDDFGSANVF